MPPFLTKGNATLPASLQMKHGWGISSRDSILNIRMSFDGLPEMQERFRTAQSTLRTELAQTINELMESLVTQARSLAPRWTGKKFRHSKRDPWRQKYGHNQIAKSINWRFMQNDAEKMTAVAWSGHFLSRIYERGFSGTVWQEYIRSRLGKQAKSWAKKKYGTRSLAKFYRSEGKRLAGEAQAGERLKDYRLRQAAALKSAYGYHASLYARRGLNKKFRGSGAAVSAGRHHRVTKKPHFSVAAQEVMGRAQERLQAVVDRAMNG